MVETRILKDKKNRRIIKMDRNKVNNNKYAYIVDTELEQELESPQTEDKAKLFLFNASTLSSSPLPLLTIAQFYIFSILL